MRVLFFIFSFWLYALSAWAQEAPVEISATHSLEWNRKEKTYTARENAVATQGSLKISADSLSAYYSDESGGTDIRQLTADGNVTIESPPYTAVGDKAVYDVATAQAVLTGGDLKISTPTEHLTARDKIEFFNAQNRLTATGNATAVRGTDKLRANILSAYFQKGADGKMTLDKITADGNVTITTARETVEGEKGVYDLTAQKATLTGQVSISQGESRIEGTRAEVDLKTGISRLFAEDNAATQGRVTGVFYPKKNATP